MTLSLFMMVKNAASVIERALSSTRLIDEVVIIDGGSTDDTVRVSREWCDRRCIRHQSILLDATTHPELHRLDAPETYRTIPGMPLICGPFSGKQILIDWGTARNLGWSLCSSDFVLTLDADDVVVNPREILPSIVALKKGDLDLLESPYQVTGADGSLRSHFARRATTRWHYANHESLVHPGLLVGAGNLIVRDMRDAPADRDLRAWKISHILVSELGADNVDTHDLSTYVQEVAAHAPSFALQALEMLERRSPPPEELEFCAKDVAQKQKNCNIETTMRACP